MKTLLKFGLSFIFIGLVVVNVFIFVSSIQMGAQMNVWEEKIGKIRKENMEMENKIVELNSYQYAASLASQLDFNQRSQAIYLENLPYALNR